MRTHDHRSISGSRLLRVSLGTSLFVLAACGGTTPPPAPVAPSKPIALADPPPDVTAVPEPAGLVLVGRITKSDAILKTLASWTKLPLPGGDDLIRSITDDSVAAAVDLSQPVDAAAAISGTKRDPKPLIAVSVGVRSFDDAKAKLGAGHKLTPGKNGQLHVEGIGRAAVSAKGSSREDEEDEETCVLAHAAQGARLVCGEKDALELLTPYLTRTVARQTWTSDVHMEMTLAAVREPLQQVRAALPFLAKQILGGTSPALGKLADAAVTEVVDVVDDTNRMTLDAQLADSGAQATLKIEYTKANSFIAKLATSNPARVEAPPPAFWHLPADTDLALYGKGSDTKLFEHPRELLGNVALEITEGAGMPETERKAVRELVVDRMLGLFMGGPVVYGKGYDAAAVDKAIATRKAVKPEDTAGRDAADHALAEQILGWHLIQVEEPITKVAPMLKDWAALWNRPAFAKWAKQESSAKMLAQMRMVGMPAGVTLPKDAVHLEIVIPRSDIEEVGPPPKLPVAAPAAPVTKPGPPGSKPAPPPPPPVRGPVKKIPRKPVTLHVIAVPDQGGTWIGFGLDAKLLGQKAAAALSTAPDAQTLGKSPAADALRDTKANAAWMTTIRGLLFFRALKDHTRTPYGQVAQLPSKGLTPITLSFTAQPPSQNAAGGSAVANLKLPRAAIEDLVKVMMSR